MRKVIETGAREAGAGPGGRWKFPANIGRKFLLFSGRDEYRNNTFTKTAAVRVRGRVKKLGKGDQGTVRLSKKVPLLWAEDHFHG